jgi:hypothetical protein
LQLIERFGFTVHAIVPEARCELPGAFAPFTLPGYVPGATANATAAETAISNVTRAVTIPSRRMFFSPHFPQSGSTGWE